MYRLRAELRVHQADVRGVAVSKQGQIATCSRDNTSVIWDSETKEPVHVLRGHTHFVNDLVFTDSGNLITASGDKTLKLWNTSTGQCIKTYEGHTGQICAVAMLPFGEAEHFVSCAWDFTARVWNLESGQCVKELKGHEAAVWSATGLPSGQIVTVSADKTVKVWDSNGVNIATYEGMHGDVVRDVIVGPKGGFITVANDSSMIYWKPSGTSFHDNIRLSDLHDGNYIYSAAGIEKPDGKWILLSGGEDNAARVIEVDPLANNDFNCVQTVMHPGTVWSVALCPNNDFVTACSDGTARVFTSDPDAIADEDTLTSFQAAVSERKVNTKVIGGVDVKKLPEADEALKVPGKKDGENKIVKTASGSAEVYMWSAADQRWNKIGEVVDNPGAGAPGVVGNQSYDFVFEVEIGEGGEKEKLGYNRGENPYLAAQRFIDQNELSQEFLDQIAKFIEQNVPPEALKGDRPVPSDPLTGGSRYVPGGSGSTGASGGDPLTGGSRYIPGGSRATGTTGSDPLTGGSRYVPGGTPSASENLPPPRKLIPHKDGVISYTNIDQLDKVQQKLASFNTELAKEGSEKALDQGQASIFATSLIPKLKQRSSTVLLSEEDCAIIEKLMKWHTSYIFPVLDIARLAISLPSGSSYFFGSKNGEILKDVLQHLSSSNASGPTYIMGCRFLCNMFNNRVSGTIARSSMGTILDSVSGAAESQNRRAKETHAALLVNYAVMLHDSKASADDRSSLMTRISSMVSSEEKDEEVLYRRMIAMGTLICGDIEAAKKGVELGVAEAASTTAPISPRLQQVALEIATIIAS